MNKRIIATLLLLMIIALTGCGKESTDKKVMAKEKNITQKVDKPSVLADLPQVVHGLGYIEGHYVTNSIDAFLLNYKRGFRVFEVDLNMTSDNRLVARHDWTLVHYQWLGQEVPAAEGPIPFDKVMSLKIHNKYQPASWEQLLELMQKYPDVYFVTDTKQKDEANVRNTFSYIVNKTKEVDPKLLDRIIPQIYDQPMLSYIKSYHDFKEVIYTLYQHTNADIPTPKELSDWCVRNHVTAVAGLPFRLTEEMQTELHEKHIVIYTHTINKPEDAAAFKEKGIGIYTDYLYDNGQEFIAP